MMFLGNDMARRDQARHTSSHFTVAIEWADSSCKV